MAKRATVEVEGARQLRATLKKAGAQLEDFKEIHRQVGVYVEREAAHRAPRRSGALAASGRPGAAKTQATIRFGGARVPYANAVHWGTGPRAGLRGPHNIRRTLFATSAAKDTQPRWFEFYQEAVDRLLARVKGV
jgi:hypothetical protein